MSPPAASRLLGEYRIPCAGHAIVDRLIAGLILARAERMTIERDRRLTHGTELETADDAEIPSWVWKECSRGRYVDWQGLERGQFAGHGFVDHRVVRVQLFGIAFRRADVEKMIPADAVRAVPPAPSSPAVAPNRGGRRRSDWWPEFSAELALFFFEQGVPPGVGTEGSEAVIEAVLSGLMRRGIEGPERTTVQPHINAALVLLRRN